MIIVVSCKLSFEQRVLSPRPRSSWHHRMDSDSLLCATQTTDCSLLYSQMMLASPWLCALIGAFRQSQGSDGGRSRWLALGVWAWTNHAVVLSACPTCCTWWRGTRIRIVSLIWPKTLTCSLTLSIWLSSARWSYAMSAPLSLVLCNYQLEWKLSWRYRLALITSLLCCYDFDEYAQSCSNYFLTIQQLQLVHFNESAILTNANQKASHSLSLFSLRSCLDFIYSP